MSSKQPLHESFAYYGKRPTTPQEVIDKVEDFVRKDLEGGSRTSSSSIR